MDSINQQQPEDNFKDLGGPEAIAKIKELVDSAKSCFFLSNIKTILTDYARNRDFYPFFSWLFPVTSIPRHEATFCS